VQTVVATLPTLAENLALDEALLDEAEQSSEPCETLRLWEWLSPAVVVGRASRLVDEVHLDYCDAHHIPVLRRSSGGCAVLIGPGCLLYSVVLCLTKRPELTVLDAAHRFVLAHLQAAWQACNVSVSVAGTSDLLYGGRKFSGNSLRYKRQNLLYHGTLLCDFTSADPDCTFDMGLFGKCLRHPPREPEYRAGRKHDDFVTRVPWSDRFPRSLQHAFGAHDSPRPLPLERVSQLMTDRYGRLAWHRER
jgi:lipoate-protein ligase A